VEVGCDDDVDVPEGRGELPDEVVAERGDEQGVEGAVGLDEAVALAGARLAHLVDERRQPVDLLAAEGFHKPFRHAAFEQLAHLDEVAQHLEVVVRAEQTAEGEALHQGGQAQPADVGAVAVPHLDDVERREDPDRLAHAGAAGAERLAQGGLGRQGIPRAQLVAQDVGLDAVHDLLPQRLSCRLGLRYRTPNRPLSHRHLLTPLPLPGYVPTLSSIRHQTSDALPRGQVHATPISRITFSASSRPPVMTPRQEDSLSPRSAAGVDRRTFMRYTSAIGVATAVTASLSACGGPGSTGDDSGGSGSGTGTIEAGLSY